MPRFPTGVGGWGYNFEEETGSEEEAKDKKAVEDDEEREVVEDDEVKEREHKTNSHYNLRSSVYINVFFNDIFLNL